MARVLRAERMAGARLLRRDALGWIRLAGVSSGGSGAAQIGVRDFSSAGRQRVGAAEGPGPRMDLQYFQLRAQVFKVYRQALRLTRDAPADARGAFPAHTPISAPCGFSSSSRRPCLLFAETCTPSTLASLTSTVLWMWRSAVRLGAEEALRVGPSPQS